MAWNADHTVFQYNEASGGETTRDGMAYDIDEGSFGTVFQYNYSHDNAGGFFLVCTATGRLADAVIRYNISRNDHYRGIETCPGSFDGVRVRHNTIYVGDGVTQTVINENTTSRHDIAFADNIVVKEGAGTATFTPALRRRHRVPQHPVRGRGDARRPRRHRRRPAAGPSGRGHGLRRCRGRLRPACRIARTRRGGAARRRGHPRLRGQPGGAGSGAQHRCVEREFVPPVTIGGAP